MNATVLHRQRLENGLELSFIDRSNRYYGDFHQVRIDVVSRFELSEELLTASGLTERERLRAINRFGGCFEQQRHLKRMGVAGPEVEAVCRQMVEQFLASALPYMQAADYPARLLRKRLAESAVVLPLHG